MATLPPVPDSQEKVILPGGSINPPWYAWFLAFVNYTRAAAAASTTGLAGKAGTSQTWEVTFTVVKVTTDPVYVILKSVKARTVTAVVTDCDSGTCTLTGQIDGTPLGGTANSVSTTESEQTHISANSIAAGQDLRFVASSVSSCRNMRVRVSGTFSLDA